MPTQPELRKTKARILDQLTTLNNLLGESAHAVQTQEQVAKFFGVELQTVHGWCKTKGPGGRMPGRKGNYPLDEIVQWLRNQGPWRRFQVNGDGDDPMLAAGDSPALERYRNARADLSELELAEKRQQLHPTDFILHVLKQWAGVYRRLGERLSRRYQDPIGKEIGRDFVDAAGEAKAIAKALTEKK